MELSSFLQGLVPPGRIIIARAVMYQKPDGTEFKAFSHTVCQTHEEAAAVALEHSSTGHDVYFALASYKRGFFTNAKGKKVVRVHENVDQLQALWFDIDFKGAYSDLPAAVAALKAFLTATGMPQPSAVVGSGNGIHVYWALSEGLPVAQWQPLADALKNAAKALKLEADLVCTADACRILRPPGTLNYKDPNAPKPVRLLAASGSTYSPEALRACLEQWVPTKRPPPVVGVNSDLTGGLHGVPAKPARFEEVARHCAVSKWLLETHGKQCSEPEWVAALQLLKHCEDGALFYHEVSNGHPGYSAQATEDKWQHRLANTAGPTLCKTFELYRPELCAKCPHSGFIKTPVQVGYEGTESVTGLPPGWRYAENDAGVERLMLTDPANNVKEWIKQFSYIPTSFRPMRSVTSGQYDLVVDIRLKNTDPWHLVLPMAYLGNYRKLVEQMASYGVVLKPKEVQPFGELMASWLKKLQSARRVADTADHLGWIQHEGVITGFACNPSIFFTDGRERTDVQPSREFAQLAKHYEPRGSLEAWKRVAAFIAEQNNPALTAVLAASFGAPLLKFVGVQGSVLSLVSTASGMGKTSVLKLAQAVWGSPIHAMNSVDDTPKSVGKKISFLNTLPAYWDELRGKATVDGFCTLAYQLTQGKERTRLDSNAQLMDSHTWDTMITVASNESIFEAMARRSAGSDAGMVRVFEVEMVQTPKTTRSSAEVTLLFESLRDNYGHAGRVLAKYLATHVDEVKASVQATFTKLGEAHNMEPAERFWYSMMAILMVGASIAKKLDLVHIDLRTLHQFLVDNLARLRTRTMSIAEDTGTHEVLALYLRDRQNSTLIIDKFLDHGPSNRVVESGKDKTYRRGRPSADYIPMIKDSPKSGKAIVVMAVEQGLVRFPTIDYMTWLADHNYPTYDGTKRLEQDLHARVMRGVLGLRTIYQGPRVRLAEIDLNAVGFSNLACSPDSSTSEEPEG